MSRLHPLLIEAKQKAEAYRVLRRRDGTINLWRFRDFTAKHEPGWKLIAQHRSRSDAEQDQLERLGLAPPVITITYQPADDFFVWGYDLGSL